MWEWSGVEWVVFGLSQGLTYARQILYCRARSQLLVCAVFTFRHGSVGLASRTRAHVLWEAQVQFPAPDGLLAVALAP